MLKKLILFALLLTASAEAVSAQNDALEAQRARLARAEAMFQERCKTAGEKIYRTVDNVDGIFLLKLRPQRRNLSNQFALDDPYGKDLGGDGYIVSFLRGSYQANTQNPLRVRRPVRVICILRPWILKTANDIAIPAQFERLR